ncbi:MAG: hypothetical protein Q7R70_03280 [Candidatus Diapherotrites archaeon]|nr:hypothetical protein [Candidatus Diapherotrites archaeon]
MPARKTPFLKRKNNKRVVLRHAEFFQTRLREDNLFFGKMVLDASKAATGKKKSSLRRIAIARRYASMLQGKKQ